VPGDPNGHLTHHPGVAGRPVRVRFTDVASGRALVDVALPSREPVSVALSIDGDELVVELTVDPAWTPALMLPDSQDIRDLGVAVRDLQVLRPSAARPALWRRALRRESRRH